MVPPDLVASLSSPTPEVGCVAWQAHESPVTIESVGWLAVDPTAREAPSLAMSPVRQTYQLRSLSGCAVGPGNTA